MGTHTIGVLTGLGPEPKAAFDGIRDVAGGLVDDAVVIGLQTDAYALSSHTKNSGR